MEDEELNEQANSEETKESVEARKRLLVFWVFTVSLENLTTYPG